MKAILLYLMITFSDGSETMAISKEAFATAGSCAETAQQVGEELVKYDHIDRVKWACVKVREEV